MVTVTASTHSIEWTDSIRPKSIYAAHFKQQVLVRLVYFFTVNPKVLFDWYRRADIYVESAGVKLLTRSSFKYFRVLRHTSGEMFQALFVRTN